MSEFPDFKRITYQKLARLTDEEIQEFDADIIILDEFHYCGALEWGKGVERLLQRNEGASVLGLSVTPLRYTDGLRDMADELLNSLRDKLDENTQNLPELFSEHMQNKSGKYIVFYRNIEDMNEKMKKYKGNDKTEKTENSKKSRLSIFDTTKEFRKIAEKITELSKRSKVKLEQKIEIFEEFMKTGEELVGNTTYEGYPIGQWAIQIRNSLNRMNDGKDNSVKINPTKDQLEKYE